MGVLLSYETYDEKLLYGTYMNVLYPKRTRLVKVVTKS